MGQFAEVGGGAHPNLRIDSPVTASSGISRIPPEPGMSSYRRGAAAEAPLDERGALSGDRANMRVQVQLLGEHGGRLCHAGEKAIITAWDFLLLLPMSPTAFGKRKWEGHQKPCFRPHRKA